MNLKAAKRYLEQQNRKYTSVLEPVPSETWPASPHGAPIPESVFRSAYFLAQVFREKVGYRISVQRCSVVGLRDNGEPIWAEQISWDDLMGVKRQVGFSGQWAVEVYPPDEDIVNVANMRHLWVIAEPVYGWKKNAAVLS